MNPVKIKRRQIEGLTAVLALSFTLGCSHSPPKDIKETTFKRLSAVKEEKRIAVADYFSAVKKLASGVVNDKKVVRLFKEIKGSPSSGALYKLTFDLDVHFVTEYSDFYDLLFVDETGLVFHSVKQESDYGTNLFTGRWAGSRLAREMKNNGDAQFVDYDYYGPSEEPAAFFVTPLEEGGKRTGWVILQSPINRVNAILSDHEGLGRTGEVYLVNGEKMMLTDSRFLADSTILKKRVETDAVRLAFERKAGQEVIDDYRGVRVFSAFEKFDLFNSSWVIIVEIDEAEVITEHYRDYKDYYLPAVMKSAMERPAAKREKPALWGEGLKGQRADVSEFTEARKGELLETRGVGPCSSVVIHYPARFGYLSHISPVDDSYEKGMFGKFLLKERRTNFLDKIMKKVKRYDIYPYEMRNLNVTVIATHFESMKTLVDSLIDAGVELAQVRVMINPYADYANVRFDQSRDEVNVQWVMQEGPEKVLFESAAEVENLGEMLKKIAQYGA